jgi:multiple sugar transport system permease protein
VAEIATTECRAIALRQFGRRFKPNSETLAAFLFLTPNIFGFLVFTAIPVLAALVMSMFDWDLLLGAKFVGLDNFRRLFTVDDVFQASFRNTAIFTVVSVPLSVCIGLGVALLTNQALRGMSFFRAVFLLPFVTVTVALSLVWRWLYLPEIGLINNVLRSLGIPGPAWLTDGRWAMWAIIIMSVWRSFGYNMVLFSAGLQAIPVHYYEAATIDGANARQRFRHITLPLLSPTMFFVLIISVINSFQVFDQALIMTAGGPGVATTTLVLHIYNVGFQSFHMGYAASIAWILFIVIFIFTLIQFQAQKRWVTYE